MQGQEAPDLPAFIGMLAGGPPGAADDEATLTAVDLACCVARDIPTVEAFVQRGVLPSPMALRLAEHAVPLMRCGGGGMLPTRSNSAAEGHGRCIQQQRLHLCSRVQWC